MKPASTRFRLLPLALALLLGGFAATTQADSLDFKQCVSEALANNPEMAIGQAQIEHAEPYVKFLTSFPELVRADIGYGVVAVAINEFPIRRFDVLFGRFFRDT